LIVYVPPANLQTVLDWDKAKFAGVNLKITADVITDMFNDTMQEATPQNKDTTETIGILEEVLKSRYNPTNRLLDLSNLGEDQLLKKNGFFQLGSTTSKMFPALMAVADKKFDSAQAKRDAITSVSLASNSLTSIAPVTTLSLTFPDLKNLTLEGNMIEDMKAMEGWKNRFRFLEQLVMIGNPIVNLPDYRQEMIRRYPRLVTLDNIPVDRPKIDPVAGPAQNPSTAVDAKGRVILPVPTKTNLTVDPKSLVMKFLEK
jgi:nuclear RNA export factor